jgi:hypothetical protein
MKRTLAILVAAAGFAAVLPGCRHTEIHEQQPAVITPAPQPAPTVIEKDRPVIIEEHH